MALAQCLRQVSPVLNSSRPPSTQSAEWPATTALYAAFTAVAPEARHTSARDRALILRDAVWATVDELRVHGRTCERVIALIKVLAAEGGLDEAHAPAVVDDIVAWCVQRYYAPFATGTPGAGRDTNKS
jgi:hypothetical protein